VSGLSELFSIGLREHSQANHQPLVFYGYRALGARAWYESCSLWVVSGANDGQRCARHPRQRGPPAVSLAYRWSAISPFNLYLTSCCRRDLRGLLTIRRRAFIKPRRDRVRLRRSIWPSGSPLAAAGGCMGRDSGRRLWLCFQVGSRRRLPPANHSSVFITMPVDRLVLVCCSGVSLSASPCSSKGIGGLFETIW